MKSVYVMPLLFSVVESVNEIQNEPVSGNSFPGVYEVVWVSVCNSCLVLEPFCLEVSGNESSFGLEQHLEQEENVSENMMANESLDEPCRALGPENESERWTMYIFFCVRVSSNEIQKQKESGVWEREISIAMVISSLSMICLVLSVSVVLANESSCVLGPSCATGSGNGLNSLSSSNNWTRCCFG